MGLRGIKWAFAGLSLGSVFVAAFFMLSEKHSIQRMANMVGSQVGTSITNPDIKEYEGDILLWRIKAKKAQEKGLVVILESPVIDLFSDKGKQIPIQAVQGEYHKKEQQIHLSGDVIVKFGQWTLSSELLVYEQEKGEIKATEPFVLQSKDMKVTGKDLTIFRNTQRVRVLKGVHMVLEYKQ